MKRKLLFVLFFLSVIHSTHLFAGREPKSSIKTTKLKDHFYKIFVHDYVNMVVFEGQDGILLVDSGLDPVDMIEKEIRTISDAPIRYIINTHSNGDHILGNAEMGKEAVIISSEACREDILKREGFPATGLPNLTFIDSMRIHFNGEEISLYFIPGHTGNDIVVYFEKANIVCIGDLVFSDSFPGTQAWRGGNAFVLEKAFKCLIKEFPEDALFVSGHGRDYSMKDMKEYHNMIQKTIALVKPLIEQGLTLDEIKKTNPLKDWTSWNSTFFPGEITTDTWIENIFESVEVHDKFTNFKGPYFGQKKPGTQPEMFAPGIMTTKYHEHSSPVFSPDGNEVYWSVFLNFWGPQVILVMHQENGRWTEPEVASFSGRYSDGNPCFSFDGKKLFFESRRPIHPDSSYTSETDLWIVERMDTGWGEPKHLGWTVNSPRWERGPCISANGNLYFCSMREDGYGASDIYKCEWVNGKYSKPQNLGPIINTKGYESFPYIAPDESFLIYESATGDLFIHFRKSDDSWSEAINMAEKLESSRPQDRFPRLSNDGKFFFFVSNRWLNNPYCDSRLTLNELKERAKNIDNGMGNVYWMEAKIIDELKPRN